MEDVIYVWMTAHFRGHPYVALAILVLYVTSLHSASSVMLGTSSEKTKVYERSSEDSKVHMNARSPCAISNCQLLDQNSGDSLMVQRWDNGQARTEALPASNKDMYLDHNPVLSTGVLGLILRSASSDNLWAQTVPGVIPPRRTRRLFKRAAVTLNDQKSCKMEKSQHVLARLAQN
ncbi:hypothetical protein GDO78_011654 [Eleutherodactylus coqui]|uniref:Uncharacterized protein n=1 Tax=Eleutherodactylus coqui TaxID=57060 RepID=A0A8J6K5A2_ELECQ|nr:hypothetical protein GDO78_011654 [Eleutherodactylus coqui]